MNHVMRIDEKIAHCSNGKQHEPEGDPTKSVSAEELNTIRKGIWRWKIAELACTLVFIVFMLLGASEASKHSTPTLGPETLDFVGWLTVEFVSFYFIFRFSGRIGRKTNFGNAIYAIDKQANELKLGNPPNEFIGNLSMVRFFLLKWIGNKSLTPQHDYYVRRLRKEIEIFFSVVPEILFVAWYKMQKEGESPIPGEKLTYRQVDRWVVDIGLHTVAERKAFKMSSLEYWTLLYILREKNEELKRFEDQLLIGHRIAIDTLLDRLERQSEIRRGVIYGVIRDLAIAALPVILTAFLIGFV